MGNYGAYGLSISIPDLPEYMYSWKETTPASSVPKLVCLLQDISKIFSSSIHRSNEDFAFVRRRGGSQKKHDICVCYSGF